MAETELLKETTEWFVAASDDLRTAELLLSARPPLPKQAAFHSQQAAEKSLKGFLVWHREGFRKTHSLGELGEQCVAIDSTLEPAARRAADLTQYAWRFRYPGAPYDPEPDEIAEALAAAKAVYGATLDRLPAPLRNSIGRS